MRVLRFILWAMFRLLFSLRYRVRVHGLEQVRNLKEGALILPNHPGFRATVFTRPDRAHALADRTRVEG